jgi:undecaprenyl-diphosphatase
MDILQAVILGVVQGIAEFLPISSSGHLALMRQLSYSVFDSSQFTPTLTFDIFLHVATLFSVVYIYFDDVKMLFNALVSTIGDIFTGKFKLNPEDENKKLLYMLAVTTLFLIPVAFIADYVEIAGENLLFLGIMFFLTAILTFATDKVKQGDIKAKNITGKNACFVGITQMIAVLPGLSRSGTSIFGGVLSGMKREFAVKYSFLASIPAIVAAAVFKIKDIISGVAVDVHWLPYIAGGVAAFIVGVLSIGLVKNLAKKFKFKNFSYYCLAISILTVIIYFRG